MKNLKAAYLVRILIFGLIFVFTLAGCSSGSKKTESAASSKLASAANTSSVKSSSVSESSSSKEPVSSASLPKISGTGVKVLMYHDIMTAQQKGKVKNGLVITTEEFDRQMAILKSAGFETITPDELYDYIKGKTNLERKILITFDDGYKTCGCLAAPILKKYGFRATIFVITGYLDPTDQPANTSTFAIQYLSTNDLSRYSYALDYGSHTEKMHDEYRSKPMLISKSSSEILADLSKSRQKLNGADSIAYPFGKYSDKTIQLVKQAGFKMAFTTKPKTVQPGIDPYEIPRLEVNAPMTDYHFKTIVGIQ